MTEICKYQSLQTKLKTDFSPKRDRQDDYKEELYVVLF